MSGFDPEMVSDGAQLAGFHLEAGQRNFMEVSRIIAAELNTDLIKLRPYLRAWFNGARDALEDFGIDVRDASTHEEVAAAMRCFSMWAGQPPGTDHGIEASAECGQTQTPECSGELGVANG